jgi:excinuclease ABC subunit A
MHFLPDVYVPCDVCRGRRYNRETLEVRFKGKNIADVLDLTVAEGLEYFVNQPRVHAKLETLNDVGLGYIHLGQSATTLSGGEAQRVKLATELSKRDTGRTLYILDEPTTGLHFEDVRLLLEVLHRLVEKGNTVVVIEHNLDVVKTADWVIDLGPEGGDAGGRVVVAGSPEDVVRQADSATGRALAPLLAAGRKPL